MDVSSCVGRYDGDFNEDTMHGIGTYSAHYKEGSWGPITWAKGGWTYYGTLERDRPTEGELVEADGRLFKVTYAKDCATIWKNPKAKTKVGAVCGAAAEELPAVRTRAREAAGMCGAGHCVGTLAVDMLRTVCMCGE
jgi:hypothetical protein